MLSDVIVTKIVKADDYFYLKKYCNVLLIMRGNLCFSERKFHRMKRNSVGGILLIRSRFRFAAGLSWLTSRT